MNEERELRTNLKDVQEAVHQIDCFFPGFSRYGLTKMSPEMFMKWL